MGFIRPIELPELGSVNERVLWQNVYNTALQYFLKEEQSGGAWFRQPAAFSTERCLKLSAKMADRAVIDFQRRVKGNGSNAK